MKKRSILALGLALISLASPGCDRHEEQSEVKPQRSL